MPSSRTNIMAIEKKIRELQEREASNDGLSDANSQFLGFLLEWRKHANTDPLIVIQPKGALTRRGQKIPAKIIAVTDQTAADLFAFAQRRGQLVRLATAEETKRYHAHVKAQQDAAFNRATAERTALMRNQLSSLLGNQSVPHIEPAPPSGAPEPLATPFEDGAEDAESLVPGNMGEVPDSGPSVGAPETSALARGLGEIAGKKNAAKLAEGGFGDLAALAAATPNQLTALGIAAKTASSLIADANEAIAKDASESEAA